MDVFWCHQTECITTKGLSRVTADANKQPNEKTGSEPVRTGLKPVKTSSEPVPDKKQIELNMHKKIRFNLL